jgi:hypothetical protein
MLIAYASGAANPTQSQSDFIVDLLNGDTLPTTAQLYGGGIDSNDPSAVFNFSWSVLRRPPTSNGALNDGALQNPTLGAVDVWGNYLLFLIVTNPATGESSEIDPLAAPSTAFVRVRVRSEELGLEKPAAGERDWQARAHEWVDAIEDHESRIDDLEAQGHNLNDLLDVTLGTLTSGQGLVYDGAEWVNGEVASDLDALSDVTLGTLTSGQALVYNGAEWVNSTPATALTVQDEYGADSTTINLVDDNLVLVSDNQSVVVTHGTISGNPKLSIDVASTLTVDTMNVNGDLTVNADGDAADPLIYMLDGSINVPALKYDTSEQTFKVKRTSAEGFTALITEADKASTTEYGVVRVETNTTGYNSTARILDVERLMFTGIVDGMVDYKSDSQQHKSNDPNSEIEVYQSTSVAQHAALVFKNITGEIIAISDIALVMASSGVSLGNEYAFSFVVYNTLGALVGNTANFTYALPSFQRLANNAAGACEFNYVTHNAGTPIEVPQGAYFGILVTSQPDYAGNRLQCTMQAFRLIN